MCDTRVISKEMLTKSDPKNNISVFTTPKKASFPPLFGLNAWFCQIFVYHRCLWPTLAESSLSDDHFDILYRSVTLIIKVS